MKENALHYFLCPCCETTDLVLNDNVLPIREIISEVIEGTLYCSNCGKNFPVLLGLPILVPRISDYVTKHEVEILLNLHEFGSSISAIEYINDISARSIYGNRSSQESWESKVGIDTYIHNQYILKVASDNKYFSPPFDEYNFYSNTAKKVRDKVTEINVFVDMGCGTAGFIHHMKDVYDLAIGLDYSFSAVLAAQRLQKGIPSIKSSYNFYISSQRRLSQNISVINQKEVHFVVGDATQSPLKKNIADIVSCINILEIVSSPKSLISTVKKTLKPEGLFVNSSPYYWRNDRSPKDDWITLTNESESEAFLRYIKENEFNIIDNIDNMPWFLMFSERYWQTWGNHLVIANKNV